MELHIATRFFDSLSSATRLEIFRLLVRHSPNGLVAGEIAAALNTSPNTLSFHLKALAHTGLVTVEQQGRYLRYRADVAQMHALIAYLSDECCAGDPQQCQPDSATAPDRCGDTSTFRAEAQSR